jgi:hypothetical protein
VRRARSMFIMAVGGAGVCGCFALGYNRIVCCAHVVQNFVTSSYDSNTVAAPVTFLDEVRKERKETSSFVHSKRRVFYPLRRF